MHRPAYAPPATTPGPPTTRSFSRKCPTAAWRTLRHSSAARPGTSSTSRSAISWSTSPAPHSATTILVTATSPRLPHTTAAPTTFWSWTSPGTNSRPSGSTPACCGRRWPPPTRVRGDTAGTSWWRWRSRAGKEAAMLALGSELREVRLDRADGRHRGCDGRDDPKGDERLDGLFDPRRHWELSNSASIHPLGWLKRSHSIAILLGLLV